MTRSERIVASLMHGFTSPILLTGVIIVSALRATFNLWVGVLGFGVGIVFWYRAAMANFQAVPDLDAGFAPLKPAEVYLPQRGDWDSAR